MRPNAPRQPRRCLALRWPRRWPADRRLRIEVVAARAVLLICPPQFRVVIHPSVGIGAARRGLGFIACPSPTRGMSGHIISEGGVEALSRMSNLAGFFVCFFSGRLTMGALLPCLFAHEAASHAPEPKGSHPVMNARPSPASRLWGDCLARWGGRLQCSFFVCLFFQGASALRGLEPERGWPGRVAAGIARKGGRGGLDATQRCALRAKRGQSLVMSEA
jgi:hypothetical protein